MKNKIKARKKEFQTMLQTLDKGLGSFRKMKKGSQKKYLEKKTIVFSLNERSFQNILKKNDSF